MLKGGLVLQYTFSLTKSDGFDENKPRLEDAKGVKSPPSWPEGSGLKGWVSSIPGETQPSLGQLFNPAPKSHSRNPKNLPLPKIPCSKMGYLKSAQMLPFEGHLAKLAKHEPIWVPRWWPYNDTLVSTMTTLAMALRSCRNIDPLLQKLFSNFQKNWGLLPNPGVWWEPCHVSARFGSTPASGCSQHPQSQGKSYENKKIFWNKTQH